MAALDFTIPAELRRRLDEATELDPVHPYVFFQPALQDMLTGGVPIEAWLPAPMSS